MKPIDFAAFVDTLADASGAVILPFFRSALGVADKSGGGVFDPVTEADRAGELAMRALIERDFPEHGIVGEEFGTVRAGAEYVWVLDPIDGTKSFVCGLPLWGTLIGLQRRGRPVYGLMHQPFTAERFVGDGGESHWHGRDGASRRLATRRCASVSEARMMTTSPLLIPPDRRARFAALQAKVRLPRFGGDCYAYCMLAAGHVDLVVESGLQPYDVAALIPIIEGAGGLVTTWTGGDASAGGDILAAGDPAVHREAMAHLAG